MRGRKGPRERIVDVPSSTLRRIEDYYDAVPRAASRAEDHRSLTLFVNRGAGWPYYARPRRDWRGEVVAAHVRTVRARQRALGVPESFEWVAEMTPDLAEAARAAGLSVHAHPLLVLDLAAWRPAPAPPGAGVRIVPAGAPDLATLRAVAGLAFGEPGTAVGSTGRSELPAAAAAVSPASVTDLRERLRSGLTVLAAAYDPEGPLAVGSHQPVGGVSEIAGVGTLPAARRRGLAAAVTSALVRDALEHGVEVVFLSAADEDVARVYRRLGFTPIATAMIAEPAGP
jgi:ribosomal protein S18 acetylase RimI-like enzyme